MIGIIGGSGFYQLPGIEGLKSVESLTPFGNPSARVVTGTAQGRPVAFLPRHGENHEWLPSEINYRANLYALKQTGVREVIGISAVGSLRESIPPGTLCIPNQYIDLTKGKREATFFGEGLSVHISTAEPTCPTLTERLLEVAAARGISVQPKKTYACVEGPRLGTKAESHYLRAVGADLVGMTNVPEVFLAREAQLCYATIAIATDYDSWQDDPSLHASADKIIALYRANLERIQNLVMGLVTRSFGPSRCSCRESLKGSIVVSRTDLVTPERRRLLEFLQQ